MKVDGAIGSLVQGVSQQVPSERRQGQHGEQVNMIPDPVRGLVRRHGTKYRAELTLPVLGVNATAAWESADAQLYRTFDYSSGGIDYSIIYANGPRVSTYPLPVIAVYDKTNARFLTVVPLSGDLAVEAWAAGGCSAITSVGKYVFFAGHNVTPAATNTTLWAGAGVAATVLWVRGGAYSRTYTATLTTSLGATITISHTTPSSSYGGVLDTSSVPVFDPPGTPNPNYSKAVNDITNAYNTAVTAWIGTASAAIQPAAIALALANAAIAAGLTVNVNGASVGFTTVTHITVNDGGDGTLLRGLANTAKSVADLTDAHYVGKVVKVSPTGGESFYMQAKSKTPGVTWGVTEALWVECPAIEREITGGLIYGVAVGTNFYVASSASILNTLLPGTHPTYAKSTAGDDDTCPMPYFIGKKITYLGVFQDRLMVGSGGVLRLSKTGDYLNFFRDSVLTTSADSSFEILSQGAEDDVLKYGVMYDRDLVLCGKRQYAISGRTSLTPNTINMPVMSTHEGADDACPVAIGSTLFYAKRGQGATGVYQIEPGRNTDSPDSFPVSSQLVDYMPGDPVEMTAVPKPTTLVVRTTGAPHSLFLFSYLDTGEQRAQDCWHRWVYSEYVGKIVGVSNVREGFLMFSLRHANTDAGATLHIVADLQPLDSNLSSLPYLDSSRTYSLVGAPASSGSGVNLYSGYSAAYAAGTTARFLGAEFHADVPALITSVGHTTGLTSGIAYYAGWVATNPAVRDSDGKVITQGRLTVSSLGVSFKNSSGFAAYVTYRGATTVHTFDGRIVGDPSNIPGQVPVSTGSRTLVIGLEAQEYTLSINALSWLPLNITSVSWTGQHFHRPQRVG